MLKTTVLTSPTRVAVVLAVPVGVLLLFAHNLYISGSNAQPPGLTRTRMPVAALGPSRLSTTPSIEATQTDLRTEVAAQRTLPILPPHGQSLAARENADVAYADRLLIKFHGHADLSGEYRIRSDGSISIPVVGRIHLEGMTQTELEKTIASRLSSAMGRDAYITVEILEYRPVFVTGHVARPGAFPWRPGLTVLQAQALAGGTFRQAIDKDPSTEQEAEIVRLQKLVSEQKRNIATLARLSAERRGRAAIEVPSALIELVGAAEGERLIEAQASALASRRAAVEAKRTAIMHAVAMANRELEGLTELAKRQTTLLSTRKSYKNQIDELRSKGIVRAERTIDEAARVFDLEDRGTNINVSMARVRVLLAGLERDRVTLELERLADIDQEMIALDNRIAQLGIDIEAVRMTYQRLTGQDPPMSLIVSEKPKKLVLTVEILRHSASGPTALRSDNFDLILPGDTLLISFE